MMQKMLDNIADDQRVREMQGAMKKSIDQSRNVVTFSIHSSNIRAKSIWTRKRRCRIFTSI